MDRGPDPRRDPHPARVPRVAHRAGGARQGAADPRVLRRRRALGVRREVARRARLRERHLSRGRLHRLEAQRAPDRAAAHARCGEAPALQPPSPHSGGRRGGTAEAARVAHPPHRRRRPRLAGVALPRRSRRWPSRHRRRRRRRRVEPAAPDRALDRAARRLEGGVRQAHDRGAQPRRRGGRRTRSASPRRTSTGSSPTAGT